jgi:thiamine monophosphate synthase
VISSGKILARIGRTLAVAPSTPTPPEHPRMNIEVAVPDEWTPGQALAMRQLLQHALKTGIPIISLIRKDASADQLKEIYDRVEAVIKEAGLQVE